MQLGLAGLKSVNNMIFILCLNKSSVSWNQLFCIDVSPKEPVVQVQEDSSNILDSLRWTRVHQRETISTGGKKYILGELITPPE